MDVKQIYNLVNNITKEVVGETGIINEDLSNVVDVGNTLFDNMISFDNLTQLNTNTSSSSSLGYFDLPYSNRFL